MDPLNEIITKNANLAMERASAESAKDGSGPISEAEVARRMTRRLYGHLNKKETADEFARKGRSMARSLRALLKNEKPWRSDHISAFSGAVHTFPSRLVSEDYDEGKVSEASRANLLSRALGRRLTVEEVRVLVDNINQELEKPGMFDLKSARQLSFVAK